MSYSLTDPQKKLVRDLLKVGRWNNESEIIRYGLHLVATEVERVQARSFEPYPNGLLARAYKKLSKADLHEEKTMEQASALPLDGELG